MGFERPRQNRRVGNYPSVVHRNVFTTNFDEHLMATVLWGTPSVGGISIISCLRFSHKWPRIHFTVVTVLHAGQLTSPHTESATWAVQHVSLDNVGQLRISLRVQ